MRRLLHLDRDGQAPAARFLTPQDVQARLRIGRSSAYELVQRLPHVKIGRSLRLREDVLEQFLSEGGDAKPSAPASSAPAQKVASEGASLRNERFEHWRDVLVRGAPPRAASTRRRR